MFCRLSDCSFRSAWLAKIHDIADSAVSKQVGNMAHILAYLFNSAFRQCYKVWPSQFQFFTILRIPFLLVRLVCMVLSTSCWYRLTNNSPLDYPSLQPLWGVPEPSQELGSGLMSRNRWCQIVLVPPWQRSFILILSLTVIRVAESELEVHLQVQLTLGRRGAMGYSIRDVLHPFNFIFIIFICCAG